MKQSMKTVLRVSCVAGLLGLSACAQLSTKLNALRKSDQPAAATTAAAPALPAKPAPTEQPPAPVVAPVVQESPPTNPQKISKFKSKITAPLADKVAPPEIAVKSLDPVAPEKTTAKVLPTPSKASARFKPVAIPAAANTPTPLDLAAAIPVTAATPTKPDNPDIVPKKITRFKTLPTIVKAPVLVMSNATAPANTPRIVKKKIVSAAFNVKFPNQVADIDDIAHGFAEQLSLRLNDSKKFLSKTSPYLLLLATQDDTPATQMTRQMAQTNDSQFVITGEIRDAGIVVEKKLLGMWSIPRRHFEVDLSVLDGESGILIARHVLHQQVIEEVELGRDKPFGSQAFYATTYGKAIGNVLDEAVKRVMQDVEEIPVVARIVKIRGGQLVIDAGSASALAVGDEFYVFNAQYQLPANGLTPLPVLPPVLGVPERKLGNATITQVERGFAQIEVNADPLAMGLREGDYVRLEVGGIERSSDAIKAQQAKPHSNEPR
jgi:Flagellar assembly protein T, middle domain